jgi:hypothetical protein
MDFRPSFFKEHFPITTPSKGCQEESEETKKRYRALKDSGLVRRRAEKACRKVKGWRATEFLKQAH